MSFNPYSSLDDDLNTQTNADLDLSGLAFDFELIPSENNLDPKPKGSPEKVKHRLKKKPKNNPEKKISKQQKATLKRQCLNKMSIFPTNWEELSAKEQRILKTLRRTGVQRTKTGAGTTAGTTAGAGAGTGATLATAQSIVNDFDISTLDHQIVELVNEMDPEFTAKELIKIDHKLEKEKQEDNKRLRTIREAIQRSNQEILANRERIRKLTEENNKARGLHGYYEGLETSHRAREQELNKREMGYDITQKKIQEMTEQLARKKAQNRKIFKNAVAKSKTLNEKKVEIDTRMKELAEKEKEFADRQAKTLLPSQQIGMRSRSRSKMNPEEESKSGSIFSKGTISSGSMFTVESRTPMFQAQILDQVTNSPQTSGSIFVSSIKNAGEAKKPLDTVFSELNRRLNLEGIQSMMPQGVQNPQSIPSPNTSNFFAKPTKSQPQQTPSSLLPTPIPSQPQQTTSNLFTKSISFQPQQTTSNSMNIEEESTPALSNSNNNGNFPTVGPGALFQTQPLFSLYNEKPANTSSIFGPGGMNNVNNMNQQPGNAVYVQPDQKLVWR